MLITTSKTRGYNTTLLITTFNYVVIVLYVVVQQPRMQFGVTNIISFQDILINFKQPLNNK